MALYDPQRDRTLAFLHGEDLGVTCLSYLSFTLWSLGYPDQAIKQSHEALTLARTLSHPFSLARALAFAASSHQFRSEGQATQARAEEAMALATERGLAHWLAHGMIMRGWALVQQGQSEEGIAQMRQGVRAYQATGAQVGQLYFLGLLSETYGAIGQAEEGLAMLIEALTIIDTTEQRWWQPELYRLKGELLLSLSRDYHDEAEECFHYALDTARHQQAKSSELRAAMSLARLWQQQGKRAEAYELLAPVYSWFTEGFDTADLQDAKALLAALA